MFSHDLLLLACTKVLETADGGHMLKPRDTGCRWEISLGYGETFVDPFAAC